MRRAASGGFRVKLHRLELPALLVSCALLAGCASPDARRSPARGLLILRNAKVVVGILPEVGGRVVLLKRPAGHNVLKSDSALWNERRAQRPVATPDAGWKAYDGQIVWVGPQSAWWTDQDANPKRREQKAGWPPDPYLVYGQFEVVERTETSVRLVGPESPVTGVQLTKEIRLEPDGRVRYSVSGRNSRDRAIARDLWPNLRMSGFDRCYVPVAGPDAVRVEGPTAAQKNRVTVAHRLVEGFFTFAPELPNAGKSWQMAKAFIQPNAGLMAGFTAEDALLIRFSPVPKDRIHPDQGQIEIFNSVRNRDGEVTSLLELEMHSPFRSLAPGETITVQQIWEVIPYYGRQSDRARTAFLRDCLAAGPKEDGAP
ncbi:MAG: DUF4380 domain-containing protein [Kiritimatiellae bacterium]|nr:DUF4380 domain-containing protein [Kiritimatiellia bacterium]